MFRNLLLAIAFTFSTLWAAAQVYPVSSTVTVPYPSPIFLSEYVELTSTMSVTATLNDFNQPSQNFRLKITIEGNGIVISTNPNYLPAPLTLSPNIPYVFSASDLADYFSVDNLVFSGIDVNAFVQSGGKIPEGMYQFCAEILDYNTGRAISGKGCAFANIFQEQPPRLLQPACENIVMPSTPQNILFQWQVAPGGSPALSATALYTLYLFQIIDENANGYNAVQNGQAIPVYESQPTPLTTFNLDLTTTQLLPNKRYAWRVKATDQSGKDVYANEGFSAWCWFNYGYPTGGAIQLKTPVKDFRFTRTGDKILTWGTSDKGTQGQSYDYKLKIVKMEEGQNNDDAMANNQAWLEETLPNTSSTQGASYEITQTVDPEDHFAWQVVAETEGVEVASSEVWDFWGPPLILKFNAGNFTVFVKRSLNKDLNDYKGIGLLQLSSDPNDTISCEWEHINLKEISGDYFMEGGEVYFDLSWKQPLSLKSKNPDNPNAKFIFDKGKLDKIGMYWGGIVELPFPHAVVEGGTPKIKSKLSYFQIDEDYEIAGTAKFDSSNVFNLAEPMNHTLQLSPECDLLIANNEYLGRFAGMFILPPNVRTNDGERYILPFPQVDQLFYMEVDYLLSNSVNFFRPLKGLGFDLKPKKAIIDLSEKQSPGKLSGDKGFKGAFFPEFVAVIDNDLDPTHQLDIQYDKEYDVKTEGNTEFWSDARGLHFRWEYEIKDDALLSFNSFRCELKGNLEVIDNEIQNSKITGSFKIPFLDDDRNFSFTIPVTEDGIQEGYLDESLASEKVIYNPFGGENRIEVTIKRAVFADNERIDAEIDVDIPSLNAQIKGIDDFRMYGDNYIGIGGRNGKYALTQAIQTEYRGYPFKISEFEAAYKGGVHALSYSGAIDMGEEIAGKDGSPLFSFASAQKLDAKYQPNTTYSEPSIDIPENASETKDLACNGIYVETSTAMVELKGFVEILRDDPDLGNAYKGKITGTIKIPTDFNFEASMILSQEDRKNYWYFDAYFQDKEGIGVPFIYPMNLVGFEARMFHHMSLQNSSNAETQDQKVFKYDQNVDYGAALFLQMVDGIYQAQFAVADVGAELTMTGDNFTINMKGDMSMFNATARKSYQGELTKAAVEEAAGEILDQIFPIEIPIDLGGGHKLTVAAENLKTGSLAYENNDFYTKVTTRLDNVPGGGLAIESDGYKVDAYGDADGQFKLDLSKDATAFGISYNGSSEGALSLKAGGADIATDFNRTKKSGNVTFNYQDIVVKTGVDQSASSGYFDLGFDGDKKIIAGIEGGKAGWLGYQDGSVKFKVSGNANTKAGLLDLEISGMALKVTADGTKQEGDLKMKTSSYDLELAGKQSGFGKFKLTRGSDLIDLQFNKATGAGYTELKKGSTDRFKVSLTEAGEGALLLATNGIEFGVSGNKEGTEGGVLYKDASNTYIFNGNRIEKTGDLKIENSTFTLNSEVKKDTVFADYKDGSIELFVGAKQAGSGTVRMKQGSNEYLLAGNLTTQSGRIKVLQGGRLMDMAANKPAKTANLTYSFSSDLYEGNVSPQKGMLHIKNSTLDLFAEGDKAGVGKVSYKTATENLAINADAPAKKGSVLVEVGSKKFDADIDQPGKIGHLNYEDGNKTFTLAKGENDAMLNFSIDGIEMDAFGKSDGQGRVSYTQNSTGFYLAHNLDAKADSFKITSADVETEAYINQTDIKAKLYYRNGADKFLILKDSDSTSTEFDAGNGKLKLMITDAGTAFLGYTEGPNKYKVLGNPFNSKGGFGYEGANFELEGESDFAAKTHTVVATEGPRTYTAEHEDGANSIVAQQGDYSVFATYKSAKKTIGTGYQEKKITLVDEQNEQTIFFSHQNLAVGYNTNDEVVFTDGTTTYKIKVTSPIEVKNGEQAIQYVLDNMGKWEQTFTVSGNHTVRLMIADGKEGAIEYNHGDYTVLVEGSADAQNAELTIGNDKMTVSNDGTTKSATYNDYTATLSSTKATVSKGTNRSVEATADGAAIVFDNITASAHKTDGVKYADGTYELAVSEQAFLVKKGDMQASASKDGKLLVQKEANKKLQVENGELKVVYDNRTITAKPKEYITYAEPNRSYSVSQTQLAVNENGKKIELEKERLYVEYASDMKAEAVPAQLSGTYTDKSFSLTNKYVLTYQQTEFGFVLDPEKGVDITKDDKRLKVAPDELIVQYKANQKMEMNKSNISMTYDDKQAVLGIDSSLTYRDAVRSFSINPEEIKVQEGDKFAALTKTSMALQYDKNKNVALGMQSLAFKYDKVEGSFEKDKNLNFTDGTRSFALTPEDLQLADEDQKVALALTRGGGKPAVRMGYKNDAFKLNQDSAVIDYDGRHYLIDKNTIIDTWIEGNHVIVSKDGASVQRGLAKVELFGGGNKFVTASYDKHIVGLSTDETVSYTYEKYNVSLTKALALTLTDQTHYIGINHPDYMAWYQYDKYKVGANASGANEYQVDVIHDNKEKLGIKVIKNTSTTFSVTTPAYGTNSVTVDNNSNFDVAALKDGCELHLKAGNGKFVPTKKGSGCDALIGQYAHLFMTEAGPPEKLAGAPEIPQQEGPQYMEGSVSEAAGGMARGLIEFYYDSKTEHMIANAAVKAEGSFCVDAAMSFESSPGKFDLKIGTEQQRVRIIPACSNGGGFGGNGWMHVNEKSAEVAVAIGMDKSASVTFGRTSSPGKCYAEIGGRLKYEFGTKAKLVYSPEVYLDGVAFWIEVYMGIYAKYDCVSSGSVNIAEAYLKGQFAGTFSDKVYLSGGLDGYVNILDLWSDDFSINFSQQF